jgi:putative transposase
VPHPLRPQLPNGYYHVTARGARQQRLFFDEFDYVRLLSLLAKTVARFGWRCFAYALLPNHYHLFVQTPKPNLSAGMEVLNHRYAVRFNVRYGFAGHAFDRRFNSVVVVRERHFLEVSRYIVLNPVRAGLGRVPGEWAWSSYLANVGAVPAPDFLDASFIRSLFSEIDELGAAAFAAYVAAAPDQVTRDLSSHVPVAATETWPL